MYYLVFLDDSGIVVGKLEAEDPPASDNILSVSKQEFYSIRVGSKWTGSEFVWTDKIINEEKERLSKLVAERRKSLEREGLVVKTSLGDFIVDTSQIGRSNLQGTILTYEIGLLDKATATVPWKFENGFAELGYDQLKEIASFVVDYIEKLFAAEKQHNESISQLTTAEGIKRYDISQYWPSNEYVSQMI